MDEKSRANLLLMYGVVREQENLIYSLMALITPLVSCLGHYDQRLADLYSREAKAKERVLFEQRDHALAAIDEATRRLIENVD
jgi:hypothetical protein